MFTKLSLPGFEVFCSILFAVENGHSRFSCEPEYFHLSQVDISHRAGTIGHVDDACPTKKRFEEFTVIFELWVIAVFYDILIEVRYCRLFKLLKIMEQPVRVLKAGGVCEPYYLLIIDDDGENSADFSFPRHRADSHTVVFRQSGKNR